MNKLSKTTVSLQTWTEQELLSCSLSTNGSLVRAQYLGLSPKEAESSSVQVKKLTPREKAHLRAAYYWLNQYQPKNTESPLEQVKGLLESAYYLQEIGAWELVSEILNVAPSQTHLQPFHQQLGTWGYFREQINVYQPLVGKVNSSLDHLCLNGLGNAHTYLSQYSLAVSYHQQNLNLAVSDDNCLAQLTALSGLGECYMLWGKYDLAEKCLLKHLALIPLVERHSFLCEKVDRAKSRALSLLSYVMYFLRRYRQGVQYGQQSLKLARSTEDFQSEWMALGAMALSYSQLGKHQKAMTCLKERFQKRHQNPDRHQKLIALIDLGATYCYQLDFEAAITCLEEVIDCAKEIGNVRGQCQASMLLGFIYCWQDRGQLSLSRSEQCLILAQQSKYFHFESQAYSQISYVYSSLGKNNKAVIYAKKALNAARKIEFDNTLYKACGLMALGLSKIQQKNFFTGFKTIIASFTTLPPWAASDSKLILALFVKRLTKWMQSIWH